MLNIVPKTGRCLSTEYHDIGDHERLHVLTTRNRRSRPRLDGTPTQRARKGNKIPLVRSDFSGRVGSSPYDINKRTHLRYQIKKNYPSTIHQAYKFVNNWLTVNCLTYLSKRKLLETLTHVKRFDSAVSLLLLKTKGP